MKTTLEIPDQLYRDSKSTAALRGESLKDFVNDAIQLHLEKATQPSHDDSAGWRRVFGRATKSQVNEIDKSVADEFENVDLADWS